jgi:uncharacterized YigZ family protein
VADPDAYETLEEGPLREVRARGSRFLARAWPVRSEHELRERREECRRRHHDARHHCWALRLGPPGRVLERHDDDGEPSGTAGLPILGALQRADLHDAAVIVTRYFGGTKLGTGGLVRAYGEAAALALEAAPRRTAWLLSELELACTYEDLGIVEGILARHAESLHRVDRSYGPEPLVLLAVRRSRAEGLRRELVETSGGRIGVRLPAQEAGGDARGPQSP